MTESRAMEQGPSSTGESEDLLPPLPHDIMTDKERETLLNHPYLWAAVGITQTFATAIMFGWASLVPILRDEGLTYTPQELSLVFTCGAVGNYLATLPFGILLDRCGPKTTGIVASLLYGLGLFLCSFNANFYCFAFGFGLIGLARPGIQMPTLHLANLFGGRGGGGALYMSAQAAAFDAGTAVFAAFYSLHFHHGIRSSTMFMVYLIVPVWTMATSIWVWPNRTIQVGARRSSELSTSATAAAVADNSDDDASSMSSRSPYLSLHQRKSFTEAMERRKSLIEPATKRNRSQINAPLSVVLTHGAFYALSSWVAVHIYKLNFIVATINDQLLRHFSDDTGKELIEILGCMLPFGFVVLPVVATMLHKQPMMALQVANVVGLLYGGVMVYFPQVYWLQVLVVFPAVATSRQLVYSTLFHSIGQIFGFANYGVLLGLTNAIASSLQMLQTPMVAWSEGSDSYFLSNFVLFVAVFPLLVTVLYSDPTWDPSSLLCSTRRRGGRQGREQPKWGDISDETSKLLPSADLNKLSLR